MCRREQSLPQRLQLKESEIMDFLKSMVIAFSFFTTIPMPMIEWTEKRMRYVPLVLPIVGAVIGGLLFGLNKLLEILKTGNLLNAVLLSLFLLVITGGVHTDGLMDSADAYFSRREKEKKLEIMKDSRVGAFAVMALAAVLLLKIAFFHEALSSGKEIAVLLLFIPVISRTLQPSMLYLFPFAKEEGLAKMYGGELKKSLGILLGILFIALSAGIFILIGIRGLTIPATALLYYVFYYYSTKKNFGGITGDLLGAFLEISELLMIGALLFV